MAQWHCPKGGVHNANTPPVQWHARTAHAAKQNRIRGKEDKGGETKKNLPSPTRRSDVDIRVNKKQAKPARGSTPTEGEGTCRRAKRSADFPLADPGTHCTMRLRDEGEGGQRGGRRRDEVTKKRGKGEACERKNVNLQANRMRTSHAPSGQRVKKRAPHSTLTCDTPCR